MIRPKTARTRIRESQTVPAIRRKVAGSRNQGASIKQMLTPVASRSAHGKPGHRQQPQFYRTDAVLGGDEEDKIGGESRVGNAQRFADDDRGHGSDRQANDGMSSPRKGF